MREIETILSSYDNAQKEGRKCVLATVVHVKGSSYRAAGARMLVDEYGVMTGAISGGCLEGDALRKALLALNQNLNKLVTYDTSDEDDAIIGAQLGCNGIIQVLFETIDPTDKYNPIELLRLANASRHPAALVSIFNLDKTEKQEGTVCFIDRNGSIAGRFHDEALLDKITEVAASAISRQINHFGEYRSENETVQAFIDVIPPPPTLVLVGAGNDSQVLSQMAKILGWNIIVADGRPTHANDKRFSSCQVVVTNPKSILDSIEINERTAFVLMTHNYNYDLAVFRLLLKEETIPYIGILGPNKKYRKMLDDLESAGIRLSDMQSAKVYAPVGLQIGAETPAEIGLSILSEIQVVLSGSEVRHLKEISGPIHEKDQYEFKTIKL